MTIISKEEYLKAKKMVKIFEKQQNKGVIIGVIAYDFDDFKLWRFEQHFDESLIYEDKVNQFIIENKKYVCLLSVKDCYSKKFDDILETENAVENKNYNKIKINLI